MSRQLRTVAAMFVSLLVVIGLFLSAFTVDEREHVVVLQFGQPKRSITEPGLYFKIPLMQQVSRLPRTRQLWQSTAAETLVDLPTRDGKKIEVSAWAVWRITEPGDFLRVMRTVANAENQVKTRVRSTIRDVITSYELSEVVRSTDRKLEYSFRFEQPTEDGESAAPVQQPGEIEPISVGREKILEEIRKEVMARLATDSESGRGIELVNVGISDISFTAPVRRAAFARLEAFMESIAAGYESAGTRKKQEIINQTNAEIEKILGEGEEQSNIIRGDVDAEIIDSYAAVMEETGEFYNFIKTLEVYEKALTGETRLVLTTDSELFRLLKESGVAPVSSRPSGGVGSE